MFICLCHFIDIKTINLVGLFWMPVFGLGVLALHEQIRVAGSPIPTVLQCWRQLVWNTMLDNYMSIFVTTSRFTLWSCLACFFFRNRLFDHSRTVWFIVFPDSMWTYCGSSFTLLWRIANARAWWSNQSKALLAQTIPVRAICNTPLRGLSSNHPAGYQLEIALQEFIYEYVYIWLEKAPQHTEINMRKARGTYTEQWRNIEDEPCRSGQSRGAIYGTLSPELGVYGAAGQFTSLTSLLFSCILHEVARDRLRMWGMSVHIQLVLP